MCHRWSARAILCLALATSPGFVMAEDKQKDIQCEASGQYIGAYDRHYTLKVSGPKEKTWEYTYTITPSGLEGDVRAKGTYELVDGLAVFTGTWRKDEVRFGLNYGFPDGKVQFDGFFPDGDKALRYRRQWFHKVDGKWQPLEELNLTIPRDAPADKVWKLEMKGERVRWDKAGKPTRDKVEHALTYHQYEPATVYQLKEAPPEGVPAMVHLVVKDKKLEAVLLGPEGGTTGMLRGFHPGLAQPLRSR